MEPCPGGLVAAEPKGALEAERAGPVLLAGDLPRAEEPVAQLARPLEERARGRGHLSSAHGTHVEATPRAPGGGSPVALRADKALRPAQALQVRHARLLVGKELAELDEGARIVDARSRLRWRRFGHTRNL